MHIIHKYFPNLTPIQEGQFEKLSPLYSYWNEKINVISRKDIEHLYERHVLHALSIAKIIQFTDNSRILDVGTGGGFPGIPLAILFPQVDFILIDSIRKKIKVVQEIKNSLEAKNVQVEQIRVENVKGRFDFITSRAVKSLPLFYSWVKHLIEERNINDLHNGILYLKGGEFAEELNNISAKYRLYNINQIFDEPYFETKKIVHIY